MEKLLLLLFLFIAAEGLAQSGDSISVKPGRSQDTVQTTVPASDSVMVSEDMERNVSNLLSLQKNLQARKAKEKRNAMIRIGIGVGLLIILIIGLRRKTVKK